VQLKPDARETEEDLRRFVGSQLAAHKVPIVIDIRFDEMPKNAAARC